MNISIATTATRDAESYRLLELIKFIYKRKSVMAKKSMIAKQQRTPKFATRAYTRCSVCGRPTQFIEIFGLCRVCLRKWLREGLLPGVRKASW